MYTPVKVIERRITHGYDNFRYQRLHMTEEMPQDYRVMLHLSVSVVDGERGVLKNEVPRPDFITQGISPRRDAV